MDMKLYILEKDLTNAKHVIRHLKIEEISQGMKECVTKIESYARL